MEHLAVVGIADPRLTLEDAVDALEGFDSATFGGNSLTFLSTATSG